MRKIVVLFPGVRYSCDTPLLYYAGAVFRQRGYEVIPLDYGADMLGSEPLEEKAQRVSVPVLERLRELQLEQCEDVVFVSKSIGTVLAGWCARELGCPVRQIFLTPLEQTLPFISPETDIAVGAGEDPYLPADRLSRWCGERHIPLTLYPGVGHRLEDRTDYRRTLVILQQIADLYARF